MMGGLPRPPGGGDTLPGMKRGPLPVWKKILFAGIATAVVMAVATALLSASERLGLLDTRRAGDSVVYLDEGSFRRATSREGSYFELLDPRFEEVVQARFPVTPAPGTVRIVVTGGSFVRGEHFLVPGASLIHYGSIAAWLEAILEERRPDLDFEVINAGVNGQGSHRLRSLAPLLLEAQPDILIVAAGNNEGWVPPHELHGLLHDWVVYRTLRKGLDPEPAVAPLYQPQHPETDRIRGAFQYNLLDIERACAAAGVELVLATLPLNLAGYPQERSVLEPDAPLQRAEEACAEGRLDEAMVLFAESEQEPLALMGASLCQLEHGELELARDLMRSAIEHEPKGRTRPSLNAIVRRVADRRQRTLVDLEERYLALQPEALSGELYFWDAAHMTTEGYRWVAGEISEVLLHSGSLAEGGPPRPIPSLERLLEAQGWRELHADVVSRSR
jgi:lysophospholipase L1-like esterase